MGYYTDLDEDRFGGEMFCRQIDADLAVEAYGTAKAAKVGAAVRCPNPDCRKPAFQKRSYQQAFCCNRGQGNCKDAYWNLVKPRGLSPWTAA